MKYLLIYTIVISSVIYEVCGCLGWLFGTWAVSKSCRKRKTVCKRKANRNVNSVVRELTSKIERARIELEEQRKRDAEALRQVELKRKEDQKRMEDEKRIREEKRIQELRVNEENRIQAERKAKEKKIHEQIEQEKNKVKELKVVEEDKIRELKAQEEKKIQDLREQEEKKKVELKVKEEEKLKLLQKENVEGDKKERMKGENERIAQMTKRYIEVLQVVEREVQLSQKQELTELQNRWKLLNQVEINTNINNSTHVADIKTAYDKIVKPKFDITKQITMANKVHFVCQTLFSNGDAAWNTYLFFWDYDVCVITF